MRAFVFVDTNVFEHFPPLTDVDWVKLVGMSPVTLVVPQVTIRELNRHKDTSQKPRQRRRAADALRKLSQWARAASPVIIRPSVDLAFGTHEPLIEFAQFHLRREVPDDELLASAIEFATERHLSPETVLVSSADLGLQLKGQAQESITMLLMPESLRLPDEPDPTEKRANELEERLRQISNRLPKLKLTFSDGRDFQQLVVLKSVSPIDDRKMEESIEEERAEYPYLAGHPAPPQGWTFSRADQAERDEYNSRLKMYFLLYDKFLRSRIEVENWQARTRSLFLKLENCGSVPAEDITLSLRFPRGIEIIRDRDFMAIPTPPIPPDRPREGSPYEGPIILGEEVKRSVQETSSPPNSYITEISKSLGRFDVGILVRRLKHTFSELLPIVTIHFATVDEFKSFKFTYKMVASNYPQAIEGNLNVKIIARH